MQFDFEKEIFEIEEKIKLIIEAGGQEEENGKKEIKFLEDKLERRTQEIYGNLTCWQTIQIARHAERPHTLDLIDLIFTDFVEMHGDRKFADDKAVVGGLAKFNDKTIMIIGTQKGKNTEENLLRRFGMPQPEGYRKSLRLMKLAEKLKIPLVTFIDTPGAYPGIESEERGQAEAISTNLIEMSLLKIPTICVVIGEGGSGGALALGITDIILMLQYSTYSVISPEGCAAILWRSEEHKEKAAESLKLTANEIKKLGIVDEIIKEPIRGAHFDYKKTASNISKAIEKYLTDLKQKPLEELLKLRYEKYRKMGKFKE